MNPDAFQIIGSIAAALAGGFLGGKNSLNGVKTDISNIKTDLSDVKRDLKSVDNKISALGIADARIDERIKFLENKAKETLQEAQGELNGE